MTGDISTWLVLLLSWAMGLFITGLALAELGGMYRLGRHFPGHVRSTDVLGGVTIMAIGVIFIAIAISATLEVLQ